MRFTEGNYVAEVSEIRGIQHGTQLLYYLCTVKRVSPEEVVKNIGPILSRKEAHDIAEREVGMLADLQRAKWSEST